MPNGEEEEFDLDVGGIYATAKNTYSKLYQQSESAAELVRRARALVFEAKQHPKAGQNAEKIIQAEELLERAEGLVPEILAVRLSALAQTIDDIGASINRAAEVRSNVQLGEEGFGPQFDADMKHITERYNMLYRPWFPVVDGETQIPDPESMTDQDWDKLYREVEGPVFFYDLQQCKAEMEGMVVHPCTGPDFLLALELVDMAFVAWEAEMDLRDAFPLLSHADLTFFAGELEASAEIVGDAESVVTDIEELLAALVKTAAKVAKGIASTPGALLVGVAGALVVLYLARKG